MSDLPIKYVHTVQEAVCANYITGTCSVKFTILNWRENNKSLVESPGVQQKPERFEHEPRAK